MTELFNRIGTIIVAKANTSSGTELSGLRFSFDIEKTVGSKSNKAKFVLYNVAQERRSLFEDKDTRIVCKLGWAGRGVFNQAKASSDTEICFVGEIIKDGFRMYREGPDVAVSLECATASAALRDATINKSYSKGANAANMISDLASTMNLSINAIPTILTDTFLNGSVLTGDSKTQLDKLTNKLGVNWSVQDEELQITEIGKPLATTAVFVSNKTGLINIPTKNKEGFILFRTLLNPKIKPNVPISLSSSFYTGLVVPQKVRYVGDFEGNKFDCEIEAKAI